MINSPKLETKKLMIKLLSLEHTPEIPSYYSRNKSFHAATDPKRPIDFYTLLHQEKSILQALDEYETGKSVKLVITYKDVPTEVIGSISLSQIFRGPFQACFLGFSLDETAQKKGLMFEALTSIIAYAFDELNLHRIMANHLIENRRSESLLKRLGFSVEGKANEYLFIAGAWRDHVLTSLINSNWKDTAP